MHCSLQASKLEIAINFIFIFRREALEQWKQKNGPNATYRNLVDVFNKAAGYQDYVKLIYKLFSDC
jgi:hypothetical protein